MALDYITAMKSMLTDATSGTELDGISIYTSSTEYVDEPTTLPCLVVSLGDPISLGIYSFTGSLNVMYFKAYEESATDPDQANTVSTMETLVDLALNLQKLDNYKAGYLVHPLFEIVDEVFISDDETVQRLCYGIISVTFGAEE